MSNDRLALFALPLVLALGFGAGFIVGRPTATQAAASAPALDVGRVESASVERTSDPLATPTSDAGIVSAPDEGRGDALASQEASSVARRVSASASGVREETEPDADATG
ncbi:MAG: hypothetical protein AAFP22_05815, partial [Planctomycetota bacterium]